MFFVSGVFALHAFEIQFISSFMNKVTNSILHNGILVFKGCKITQYELAKEHSMNWQKNAV